MSSTSSKAGDVFSVPELFELILLELEWRQLYQLRRVNTIFRNTISASSPLQRAMWLSEQAQPHLLADCHKLSPLIRHIPILRHFTFTFQSIFGQSKLTGHTRRSSEELRQDLASPFTAECMSWREALVLAEPLSLVAWTFLPASGRSWPYGTTVFEPGLTLGELADHVAELVVHEREKAGCKGKVLSGENETAKQFTW